MRLTAFQQMFLSSVGTSGSLQVIWHREAPGRLTVTVTVSQKSIACMIMSTSCIPSGRFPTTSMERLIIAGDSIDMLFAYPVLEVCSFIALRLVNYAARCPRAS